MTRHEHAPGYVPNDAYSQEDWDEVSDNPPLSEDELSRLRPGTEGMPPAMAAAFRNRGGRPKAEARRVPISLRVDPDVLAAYKAGGSGWQTRMHDVLVAGATGDLASVAETGLPSSSVKTIVATGGKLGGTTRRKSKTSV